MPPLPRSRITRPSGGKPLKNQPIAFSFSTFSAPGNKGTVARMPRFAAITATAAKLPTKSLVPLAELPLNPAWTQEMRADRTQGAWTMSAVKSLRILAAIAAAMLGLSLSPDNSSAGGYCSDLRLTCENGRSYPICPIAVSERGELVTAHLALGRGHGVHVRLVPMGVGYRYIGPGVWFDGLRGDAMLFLDKDNPIACTVESP